MKKETLEKYQICANIFAVVAIPVLVGVFGWVVQDRMKEKEVRRDFVQIAVAILSDRADHDNGKNLRGWAVRLLDSSSPVSLTMREKYELEDGSRGISHSSLAYYRSLAESSEIDRIFKDFLRRQNDFSHSESSE